MIPIVFSTDHSYIMPTGVAITSLLRSAEGTAYDIFLLCSETVTDQDRESLSAVVANSPSQIQFVDMGESYSDTYEVRGISKSTYYRLSIPWLLPQYDKVVYADGDVVFRHSLAKLYATDLGFNLIGGVRTPYQTARKRNRDYTAAIGLSASEYINAGIQLINAKQWREEELDKQLNAHTGKCYLYQDQDIINIVCKSRISYLPQTYNTPPNLQYINKLQYCATGSMSIEEVDAAIADPVIIHYNGAKPWRKFTLKWLDWWTVYRQSVFFSQEYEDMIIANVDTPHYSLRQLVKIMMEQYLPFLAKRLKT